MEERKIKKYFEPNWKENQDKELVLRSVHYLELQQCNVSWDYRWNRDFISTTIWNSSERSLERLLHGVNYPPLLEMIVHLSREASACERQCSRSRQTRSSHEEQELQESKEYSRKSPKGNRWWCDGHRTSKVWNVGKAKRFRKRSH